MTQFKLFLELLETMNHLLTIGMTSDNVYEARMHIDALFTIHDEDSHVEASKPDTDNILNAIATKIAQLPKELKQHFQMIETFQAENEIYLGDLPLNIEDATIEQVQFIMEFFTILNELLTTGMTNENIYQAHNDLDDLFKAFEEQAETEEDRLKAELANIPNDLEDMPINVDTFFNDLADHVGISLLDESEGATDVTTFVTI